MRFPDNHPRPHWRILFAFLYLGLLYLASEWLFTRSTYENAIVSTIISVPIMATYGYHASVRRWAFVQGAWKSNSLIVVLLSGGFIIRTLLALLISIWTAIYLITQIIYSSSPDTDWYFWGALATSVPLTYLVACLAKTVLKTSGLKPVAHVSFSVIGASLIVALLLTIGYSVATNPGLDLPPPYDNFGHALAEQPTFEATNSIIGMFIDLHRYASAMSDYGWSFARIIDIDILSGSPGRFFYASFDFLNKYIIFLGVASAIGTFFLGRPIGVIFSGAQRLECSNQKAKPSNVPSDALPKAKTPQYLFALGAFILLCLVTMSLFSEFSVAAEKIGNQTVLLGTNARIESMKERLVAQLDDLEVAAYEAIVMPEIRTSFDRIRARAPDFLDWYYSPMADAYRQYTSVRRLVESISGVFEPVTGGRIRAPDMEERLRQRVFEYLFKDDPFRCIDAQIVTINHTKRVLLDRYNKEVEDLVRERSVEYPSGVEVKVTRSEPALDFADFHLETIPISARQIFGLLGSSIGTYVAATAGVEAWNRILDSEDLPKNIKKLLERVGIKDVRVTKAVTKAVRNLGRVGAVSGVGAVGSLGAVGRLGSVSAPVLVAVIAGYLIIEWVLLKTEEWLSRSQLEGDIMSAIETAERAAIVEARRVFVGELLVR